MRVNGRSGLWAVSSGQSPKLTAQSILFGALLLASGCSWFTDFKQQPKVDPWETPADTIQPRANPQMSVPIYGTSAPGFAYGRGTAHASIDSMSNIVNPVPADSISLRNGGQQYTINCAVCHGALGAANGPVTRFARFVLPIGPGSNAATNMTDGAIFGIIRNGRGLMQPYNRIEERERWDLINYLRAIQRGTVTPTTTRVGRPGETGDLVPGASFTAPTRPAPYYRPPTAAPAPATTPTPAPAPAPPRTP